MNNAVMPRVVLFNLPQENGRFPISLGYIAASLKKHGIKTALEDLTTDILKNHKQI
jgi:hypothetical protein